MSNFYKKEFCRNCRTVTVHCYIDSRDKGGYQIECLNCHLRTPERRFERETNRINKQFNRFREDYLINNKKA